VLLPSSPTPPGGGGAEGRSSHCCLRSSSCSSSLPQHPSTQLQSCHHLPYPWPLFSLQPLLTWLQSLIQSVCSAAAGSHLQPGRHQVVPGALRCAAGEQWRLHLNEAVLVFKEAPHHTHQLVPQPQVSSHARPTAAAAAAAAAAAPPSNVQTKNTTEASAAVQTSLQDCRPNIAALGQQHRSGGVVQLIKPGAQSTTATCRQLTAHKPSPASTRSRPPATARAVQRPTRTTDLHPSLLGPAGYHDGAEAFTLHMQKHTL